MAIKEARDINEDTQKITQEFILEATTISALDHENITALYGVCQGGPQVDNYEGGGQHFNYCQLFVKRAKLTLIKLFDINCRWIPLSTAFGTQRVGVSID